MRRLLAVSLLVIGVIGVGVLVRAQCDPGFELSEIQQNSQSVGWVARTELAGGSYEEHWCLLPTFKNFGSDRPGAAPTPTTFRKTSTRFDETQFTGQCRAAKGSYHLATVRVKF